jgi:hypothetical protein
MEHHDRVEDETMNELSPIAADLIDRLSRIETNVARVVKVLDGNGVPGLIGRVDLLESANDTSNGASKIKTRFMALAMTLMVALLSASVELAVIHNNHELSQQDALNVYLQKQDSRIESIELNVAVLMAGLKGDTGAQGVPGVTGKHGTQGAKGDKGGVKLFGKRD